MVSHKSERSTHTCLCLYWIYSVSKQQRVASFSFPVLLIVSDIQWKCCYFMCWKLLSTPDPCNTQACTHSHIQHTICPIMFVHTMWFICDLKNSMSTIHRRRTVAISFVSFYVLAIQIKMHSAKGREGVREMVWMRCICCMKMDLQIVWCAWVLLFTHLPCITCTYVQQRIKASGMC